MTFKIWKVKWLRTLGLHMRSSLSALSAFMYMHYRLSVNIIGTPSKTRFHVVANTVKSLSSSRRWRITCIIFISAKYTWHQTNSQSCQCKSWNGFQGLTILENDQFWNFAEILSNVCDSLIRSKLSLTLRCCVTQVSYMLFKYMILDRESWVSLTQAHDVRDPTEGGIFQDFTCELS